MRPGYKQLVVVWKTLQFRLLRIWRKPPCGLKCLGYVLHIWWQPIRYKPYIATHLHISKYSYFCFLCIGAKGHSNAYFGEGSGLIHLTDVKCSGLEYDLTECEMQNGSSHSLDVGVKCQPGMLIEGCCKRWTVDIGLDYRQDYGLDHGLDYVLSLVFCSQSSPGLIRLHCETTVYLS